MPVYPGAIRTWASSPTSAFKSVWGKQRCHDFAGSYATTRALDERCFYRLYVFKTEGAGEGRRGPDNPLYYS